MIFISFFTAPISPETICWTKLSKTAWDSGFFIYILNDWERWLRFMFMLLFISFLKTLRVCLNLKLSRNYCIRSTQREALWEKIYLMDIFLSLREEGAHIENRFYFFRYCTISRQAICQIIYFINMCFYLCLFCSKVAGV